MEALVVAALSGEETSAVFTVLDSAPVEDRLFALGLLMHASVSNKQDFADTLLRSLAVAVSKPEYPDTVRTACLAKFLREVMALELFNLRVVPEKIFEYCDCIDSWLHHPALDATVKTLFTEAVNSLLNYVNRLPFTVRLARFAFKHQGLLTVREGVLKLQPEEFETLAGVEGKVLSDVLPVLKTACDIAASLSESASRFPLTELTYKALVHLLEVKLPRSVPALNTASRYLKANAGVFTITQRAGILAAYNKAVTESGVPADEEVTRKYGKVAAEVHFEEEEKQALPTAANKCREFLEALRTAKSAGFVDAKAFSDEWRACLVQGEGIVAHRKPAVEVVEQMVTLLKAESRSPQGNRKLWMLVISCMNEMGFKDVDTYRELVALARDFIHEGEDRPQRGGRGRGRRGHTRG